MAETGGCGGGGGGCGALAPTGLSTRQLHLQGFSQGDGCWLAQPTSAPACLGASVPRNGWAGG